MNIPIRLPAFLLGTLLGGAQAAEPELTPFSQAVLGIVSYTQWPAPGDTLRLCIAGDPGRLGSLLRQPYRVRGRALDVVLLTSVEGVPVACQAVYFGGPAKPPRPRMLAQIREKRILSIGEGDALCTSGMMFCLAEGREKVSLQMNLDAIARSGLRVNANVLQLFSRKDRPDH